MRFDSSSTEAGSTRQRSASRRPRSRPTFTHLMTTVGSTPSRLPACAVVSQFGWTTCEGLSQWPTKREPRSDSQRAANAGAFERAPLGAGATTQGRPQSARVPAAGVLQNVSPPLHRG